MQKKISFEAINLISFQLDRVTAQAAGARTAKTMSMEEHKVVDALVFVNN